jgi:predicted O-linked N-acetylglucosamine transferase (SPINDLY family)
MPQGASRGVQEQIALALRNHQAGRLNEAEQLYRQILQAHPDNADALHLLGVLAHQRGQNEAAVDLIGRAIAQSSGVPAFHNNLGNALKALGRWGEASGCYVRALSLKADYVEAHYNLGVTLQAQNRLDEAAASYDRALQYRGDHLPAHNNLGNVRQAQGRVQEAISCYERVLAYRPDQADALANLGNALRAQGRLDAAAAAYARALTSRSDYAEAHSNLGIVLLEQGKLEEAEASFRRAIAHKPDFAEAYSNLGNALREQGRSTESAAAYFRAVALNTDCVDARLGLALASIPVFVDTASESTLVTEAFARSLNELVNWGAANAEKLGKAVGNNQPFYLAYRPADIRAPLDRYGDLIHSAATAFWRPQIQTLRTIQLPRERIRLLIVSGHVRRHHPVWDIVLRGLIAKIDRKQFEVIVYHTTSLVDEDTAWAANSVDRFVQGPKPVAAWLGELTQDRPDVIFYPEVGMDPATCALAALRLAPTQVAGWGHPVTTGLPSIDLFVSGELLEPPDAQQHYREQLIRLPGTGVCTDFREVQSQAWNAADHQAGTVRFALCHQPIKFDPAHDLLLARIARAVGPSEFWLASPKRHAWATPRLRERLASTFRAEGLDPEAHLRVVPWMPRESFLGFLDEMDVYLDCPAFSGYTTAWQAVHRGLPIVTWEGPFLRQRLAAGLLRQIGRTEGIATSADEYVDIAVHRAEDSRTAQTRAAGRESMRALAPKADNNREAISTLERALTAALARNRSQNALQ